MWSSDIVTFTNCSYSSRTIFSFWFCTTLACCRIFSCCRNILCRWETSSHYIVYYVREVIFSGGQQCCQNSTIAPEPTLNFSSCSSDLWASVSHCCKAVDTCWEYCCVIFCLETHIRCIKIMVFVSIHLMTMHLPQNIWKILKSQVVTLIHKTQDSESQTSGHGRCSKAAPVCSGSLSCSSLSDIPSVSSSPA